MLFQDSKRSSLDTENKTAADLCQLQRDMDGKVTKLCMKIHALEKILEKSFSGNQINKTVTINTYKQ